MGNTMRSYVITTLCFVMLHTSLAGMLLEGTISSPQKEECPICFEQLKKKWGKKKVISLPCSIKHSFHSGCIDKWAQQCNTQSQELICPTCRGPVQTKTEHARRTKRFCCFIPFGCCLLRTRRTTSR